MKKINLCFIALLMVLIFNNASAQITFQKTFGDSLIEYGYSVIQTNDSGYLIGGSSYSFNHNYALAYLVKTDKFGNLLWTKTYGGGQNGSNFNSVKQTFDGGYILCGTTSGLGAGNTDIYLIKTDSNGDSTWTRTFGNIYFDVGESVYQTKDSGYIITGSTTGSTNHREKLLLIKTDQSGDTIWTRSYGGIDYSHGNSVMQTSDNGFIVTGFYYDNSSDNDIYIIKTNTLGDTIWTKIYGGIGSYDDVANSIQETYNHGFIIAGKSIVSPGTTMDMFVIKTDSIGDTLWTKHFGGMDSDEAMEIHQTVDSGYIIVGNTYNTGDPHGNVYLVKTDSNGDTVWTKTYGGSDGERGNSVQQTMDNGYIICGFTSSFNETAYSIYLIKTDEFGNSNCNQGSFLSTAVSPGKMAYHTNTNVSSDIFIVNPSQSIVGSGGIEKTLCLSLGESEQLQINKQINIFPNPFTLEFTIRGTKADGMIEIYGFTGKKILQCRTIDDITKINTLNFKTGIYLINYIEKDASKRSSYKVIKY